MGGFFGVAKRQSAVNDLFYGVDYNSHMGTKRAGIVTVTDNGIFTRSIHNIENSYFRTKFESELDDFSGDSGIGVISDTDAQPIIVNCKIGKFAIVTVARIVNINEIVDYLLDHNQHFCEHSYDIVNPTEVVATLISLGNDIVDGINNVYRHIKGSCSMLLLFDNGDIIAARDKYGRTPIILGKHNLQKAWAATSETCAFSNLGYEIAYNVGPGEIVKFNADGMSQLQKPGDKMQVCAFLWTYYGYPPCEYEGRNVDEMRHALGMAMGLRDDSELDFVSPVPDSGIGMALGYSEGKKVPYRRGIVKYTPTWPRSFTPSTQERRELVAKMKLITNTALLKDKRVAFCDDSIVRGTQLRDNVKDIMQAGAKSVHVRISCPPLIYPCEFLNFTSSKSALELIARRVIDEIEEEKRSNTTVAKPVVDEIPRSEAEAQTAENCLSKYSDASTPEYKEMVERIRKRLGLTSLKFNTVEELVEAIGLPKERICTHCFDGSSYF